MSAVVVPLPPGRGGREAALEVDAALMRRLQAEFEQLSSQGERVDMDRWMRARLREAQAQGLVRAAAETVVEAPQQRRSPPKPRPKPRVVAAPSPRPLPSPKAERGTPRAATPPPEYSEDPLSHRRPPMPPAPTPQQRARLSVPAATPPARRSSVVTPARVSRYGTAPPTPAPPPPRPPPPPPPPPPPLPRSPLTPWFAQPAAPPPPGMPALSAHLAMAHALARRDLARAVASGMPPPELLAALLPKPAPPKAAPVHAQTAAAPGAAAPRGDAAAKERNAARLDAQVAAHMARLRRASAPPALRRPAPAQRLEVAARARSASPPRAPSESGAARAARPLQSDAQRAAREAAAAAAAAVMRTRRFRSPEDASDAISRLAREQAERELGLRPEGFWPVPEADEEEEEEESATLASDSDFVSRSSDRGGPTSRGAAASTRPRSAPAPQPALPRRSGPRGWDDSPAAPLQLPALRSRAAPLAWPATKAGGLAAPDGPLPWERYSHNQKPKPGPYAPPKARAPQRPRSAAATPRERTPLEARLASAEGRLRRLSEQTEAKLDELRALSAVLGDARPQQPQQPPQQQPRPVSAPAARRRGPGAPAGMPASAALLTALEAAERIEATLRRRWLPEAVASPRERSRPAQPSAVTDDIIDRVLQGRDAFAAHKAAGAAAAAAVECGAPDSASLAEACAERLLGQALRGLAKDVLFAAAQMPALQATPARVSQRAPSEASSSEAQEEPAAHHHDDDDESESEGESEDSDAAAVEALTGLDAALDVRDPGAL